MKIEKVLLINNISYCKYPQGIPDIDGFVAFLNENQQLFIKYERFIEKGCVAAFFIEEELSFENEYINVSAIRSLKETEIYILSKTDYMEKLETVIADKCVNCIHYSENDYKEDSLSHIDKIDLNGECYGFEKKD